MNMVEKLQRAHGTLMVVNDCSDFHLKPICDLLKQAADCIAALEHDNKHLREDCVRLRRELDDGNGEIR